MKILLTGFEPFGKEKLNSSWEVVKNIKDNIMRTEICKLKLPVAFKKASEMIEAELKREKYDCVLSLGQAAQRPSISIEYIGINLRHTREADNDSYCPKFEKISKDGPDAIVSNLPIENILKAWEENEIPSYLSFSAGTYVCNDIMYSTSLIGKELGLRSGFIHLPYTKAQAMKATKSRPFMELSTMERGVELAIEEIVKTIGGKND